MIYFRYQALPFCTKNLSKGNIEKCYLVNVVLSAVNISDCTVTIELTKEVERKINSFIGRDTQ